MMDLGMAIGEAGALLFAAELELPGSKRRGDLEETALERLRQQYRQGPWGCQCLSVLV
jgi:hypothetical protein